MGQRQESNGGVEPIYHKDIPERLEVIKEAKGTQVQVIPLSRKAVEEAEELVDLLAQIMEDGIVTAVEMHVLAKESNDVYQAAMATDDAQAAGIAFIRTGVSSQRSGKLRRSIEAA